MKKLLIFLFLTTFTLIVYSFQNTPLSNDETKQYCKNEASRLYEKTRQNFLTLNSLAEVGWQEVKTQQELLKMYQTLQKQYGNLIKIDTIAKTGLWIEIEGHPKYTKSLIVRQELDGLSFGKGAEKVTKHSCGHDLTLSICPSLAEILLKKRIFKFRKIIILHSPSEEQPKSGLDSILSLKSKDLKKYGELFAIGQHVSKAGTTDKSGTFQIRSGNAQASSQVIRLTVDATKRNGGHVAIKSNKNALEIADELRFEIYKQIESCASHKDSFLLRWTNVFTNKDSLDSHNILPLYSHLLGNYRASTPYHATVGLYKIDSIINSFNQRLTKDSIKIFRANIEGNPVLVNDPNLVKQIMRHTSNFGVSISDHPFKWGADDFAVIFAKYGVKSCLLRLIVNTKGNLHESDFKIEDESVLETSLGTFAYLVYNIE